MGVHRSIIVRLFIRNAVFGIVGKENMAESQLITGKRQNTYFKNIVSLVGIFICLAICTYLVYEYLPVNGVDWKKVFRKSALQLLSGKSPYSDTGYSNPPWVLLPLLPVALLTPEFGAAVIFVFNLFFFLIVILKLKMNVWLIFPFIVISEMLANSFNGNIEGILALGFVLSPTIGLFFALAKPQIGIGVAIFWAVESWRIGGFQKVIKVFCPVVIAYITSFLIFGFWIENSLRVIGVEWNESIWPKGIPIGLILLSIAIWKREIRLAVAAAPFFAPYLTGHSWAFVWLGLLSSFPQSFSAKSSNILSLLSVFSRTATKNSPTQHEPDSPSALVNAAKNGKKRLH